MSRYVGQSNTSNYSSPTPVSAVYTAGEAVAYGDVLTLGADGLAYWSADPTAGGMNAILRPVSQPSTQSMVTVAGPVTEDSMSISASTMQTMDVCLLSNGSNAKAWASSANVIKFGIYDTNNNLTASGNVGSVTSTSNVWVHVTPLTSGNFAVSYYDGANVVHAIFDPNGNTILAATTIATVVLVALSMVSLTGGGYVVAWATSTNFQQAVYSNTGTVVSAVAAVTTTSSAPSGKPVSVAALTGGGYVVVCGPSGAGVFQRYNAAGAAQGALTNVVTGQVQGASVFAAGLTGGGFAILASGLNIIAVSVWSATGAQIGTAITMATTGGPIGPNAAQLVAMPNGNVAALNGTSSSSTYSLVIVNGTTGAIINSLGGPALAIYQGTCALTALSDSSLIVIFPISSSASAAYRFSSLGVAISNTQTLGIAPGTAYPGTWKVRQITINYKASVQAFLVAVSAGGTVGLLSSLVATTLQKMTPVGVATGAAAATAQVVLQVTGTATMRLSYSQPYAGNFQSSPTPGNRFYAVGNTAVLYGVLPTAPAAIN